MNRSGMVRLGAPGHKLGRLLECDPVAAVSEVPDPYYGGEDGFTTVFKLIDSACASLLEELVDRDP